MVATQNFRRAFTLVELLVVIGIIAILIGILLPAVSRAKDQANTTACASTLRQLGLTLKMYQEEFKGSFPYARYMLPSTSPPAQGVDSGQDTAQNRATLVWWSVVRKYMKKGGTGNWDNAVPFQSERFMAAFNCPNGLNRDAGCDFGANPMVMPDMEWEGGPNRQPARLNGGAIATAFKVTRPAKSKQVDSELAVLWDACEIPQDQFTTQYTSQWGVDGKRLAFPYESDPNYRFRGSPIAADPGVGDNTFIEPGENKDSGAFPAGADIRWRHKRGIAANFLMGDGSVKGMGITVNYEEPQVRTKGEVRRKNIRPKAPPGWKFN